MHPAPRPGASRRLNIEVSVEDMRVIFEGLGELQGKRMYDLAGRLTQQMGAQIAPAESPAEPPAAEKPPNNVCGEGAKP